ncbi:MAG TPA: GDSL-type esterase/lipase family protein [Planctomycetaceae bacterium]|nr:GDSL-type esterase/lipase family protein [Planctomycetaceae bacterium]
MVRCVFFTTFSLLMAGGLPAADTPNKWEAEIARFEKQDAAMPPEKGQNLFVGSSSVRMWKLKESFPEHVCINRGFGGSQLKDVVQFVDRLVIPHEPRVVVLYAGDNDIGAKRTAADVHADYRRFVDRVRERLPQTKIVWVSIKPSGKRWALREEAMAANALIQKDIAAGKGDVYIDVWAPMLGDDGLPRPELYLADQLHMTPAGYAVWNKLVEPHLYSGK